MWFESFQILIPALFVTQFTIALGTPFLMWAWGEVIHERITKARWKIPTAVYLLTIAVLLDAVGEDSLHAPPNSWLDSPSNHICLWLMIGSFSALCLSLVLARKNSGPGVLAVRIGSCVLLVISVLGFIWMFMP